MKTRLLSLVSAFALFVFGIAAQAADPLPSWNDTAPKKAVIAFIERITKEGSPDFVPVPERIAVFDRSRHQKELEAR